MSLDSAWKVVLGAGFRQLAFYVLTSFIPSYLRATYPQYPIEIAYAYGMAVTMGGTFSSLLGGILTKYLSRLRKPAPAFIIAGSSLITCPALLGMIYANLMFEDQKVCLQIFFSGEEVKKNIFFSCLRELRMHSFLRSSASF